MLSHIFIQGSHNFDLPCNKQLSECLNSLLANNLYDKHKIPGLGGLGGGG